MIDADPLLAAYDAMHKGEPGRARKLIEEAPTVDAVPVVRCSECRYCFDGDCKTPYDGGDYWYCPRLGMGYEAYLTDPYRFFCADGERREDENSTK